MPSPFLSMAKKGPSPAKSEGAPPDGVAIAIETEPDADDMADPHALTFATFADAAGIPEEKRAAAEDALKAFVKSCMTSEEHGDYDV